MADLSEYERKRLENIQRNQQILRSLQIPKLPVASFKDEHSEPLARREKTPRPEKTEPARRSLRIITKKGGTVPEVDPAGPGSVPQKKEKRPRLPISHVSGRKTTVPRCGTISDFTSRLGECMASEDARDHSQVSCATTAHGYRVKSENCVVKVSRDRFYSIAVHPALDKVIVAGGTKEGELVFWDASGPISGDGHEGDRPTCFQFDPHSGSISNLRHHPTDRSKLLTTSYDGSCSVMDLITGTFTAWFTFDSKRAVVTGFDISSDGRLAFHSDTHGFFRVTDLRLDSVVQELQLHEAKIGGVSVSLCNQNSLLTCSNDRSVALWDLRALESSLGRWEYRNAITAVNFHPAIADCFVSTCYDDHIRIHCSEGGAYRSVDIPHNNQTGRWVTLFKAVWDPKSAPTAGSLLCIGNMEHRGIDLFDVEGRHLGCATSEWLTAQPAVNAFHPVSNIIASGNASGKMVLWTCE